MWKEVTIKELAEALSVNIAEVREKQKLCALIAKARKSQKLSQADLARRLNVTQGRIAQIESGIGTSRMTFDVLLAALGALGFDYRVVTRKSA